MIEKISSFVWGVPMILLLTVCHIYLTFKTGFVQKNIFSALRMSFKKEKNKPGEVSPFGALCTSLAASIGTGNIVGMGVAVYMGGPGSVFWCWLMGIFGMATNYAEIFLSAKYKVKTENGFRGGAMYILDKRLKRKGLAVMFAASGVFVSLAMGCVIQVNSIGELMCANQNAVTINPFVISGVLAVVTAWVTIKGSSMTTKVCAVVVPIMAVLYLTGCGVILWKNADYIGETLRIILRFAFTPGAAAGGLCGRGIMVAARHGVARGLFSNEAGMGSAPLASSASGAEPEKQAIMGLNGAFWDTVVMCAVTGVVIVSSVLKYTDLNVAASDGGGVLCALAFGKIPIFGTAIIVFSTVVFAYSTILGWSFQGEVCFEYLFGAKSVKVYRMITVAAVFFAPLVQSEAGWYLCDVFNGVMCVPNLICILALTEELPKNIKCIKIRKTRKIKKIADKSVKLWYTKE